MKPFIYDITGIDPIKAFLAVKHLPYSLLLDSADHKHPNSRYTFLACMPIETIEAKDAEIEITNWEQRITLKDADPFDTIQSRMRSWIKFAAPIPNMPPFQGGAAGLFGYDLARYLETLPKRAKTNPAMPDMAIGIYDQVLAHDHLLKKTWIFTHSKSAEQAERKRNHFIDLISQKIEPPPYNPPDIVWLSNFTEEEYKHNVQKVIDYIYAGDIFQANLSQRFDAKRPENFDPFLHYMHMREINPAPFAAYMHISDIKIASTSPERFITIKNKRVETRPIKGTRPHVIDVIQDKKNRNDLKISEKDRAENTMIVDLLRNDLAKVCDADSVEVTDLCKLETFANVHHLVSTITGKLRHNKTATDMLKAAFPGGSITGAPKIRAMEIIEELEPSRRGPYCGSIGYIGFDGTMDTNILIRTLIYDENRISLQVGGGIVADSDPSEEYQETLDKARGVFKSFEPTENREKTDHPSPENPTETAA